MTRPRGWRRKSRQMQNRETLNQDPCLSLPRCLDKTAAFSGCLTWSRECWQSSILPFSFDCSGSLLLHAHFLQLRRAGATLCCRLWASHCSDLSCCRAQVLGVWASGVAACRLGSGSYRSWLQCVDDGGPQAQFQCLWNPPIPEIKPVSPTLAGGFLTTVPSGKSSLSF